MVLEKRDLYRFPWSKNDNPIAWLEITDVCNLRCEGCYRQRLSGHKSLGEIKEEILFFKRWRNPDNVSIAGGEPLVHPEPNQPIPRSPAEPDRQSENCQGGRPLCDFSGCHRGDAAIHPGIYHPGKGLRDDRPGHPEFYTVF